MYLQRSIYQDLLKWKKTDSGKVLEVNGARQSGKTYILTKFAKENYRQFIYINMVQSSGRQFEACLNQISSQWRPGEKREEKPIHQALLLYENTFRDQKDTVVVIDEIQDSPQVFSLIREFAREFQAHFIVTGSYLGKTVNREYFLPAGDMDVMTLDTMSYEEFLEAAGQAGRYREISLYGASPREEYRELKKWYEIYCRIGGYPAVVKKYLEIFDQKACREELAGIVGIFLQESGRYFDDILEVNLMEQVLPSIAQTMIREKRGSSDLIKELSAVIFHEDTSRITKKSIHQAIAWLYRSHVIGYCGQVNEGDVLNLPPNGRFYFRDVGVAGYFLDIAGASPDTMAGMINENFVYTVLRKKTEQHEIAGTTPWYALYQGGEMDFFVNSRLDYCNYGIEVKAGRGAAKTANRMLRDGKIQYLYLLKGDTCGGIEDKKITVPVYLAGRIRFERGKEHGE